MKKRVLVFDCIGWLKAGGDKRDNRIFMKPATIVSKPYYQSGYKPSKYTLLVDVVFDHKPNQVSKGHFQHSLEKI